jgi:hypothetical protein
LDCRLALHELASESQTSERMQVCRVKRLNGASFGLKTLDEMLSTVSSTFDSCVIEHWLDHFEVVCIRNCLRRSENRECQVVEDS